MLHTYKAQLTKWSTIYYTSTIPYHSLKWSINKIFKKLSRIFVKQGSRGLDRGCYLVIHVRRNPIWSDNMKSRSSVAICYGISCRPPLVWRQSRAKSQHPCAEPGTEDIGRRFIEARHAGRGHLMRSCTLRDARDKSRSKQLYQTSHSTGDLRPLTSRGAYSDRYLARKSKGKKPSGDPHLIFVGPDSHGASRISGEKTRCRFDLRLVFFFWVSLSLLNSNLPFRVYGL